MDEDKKNIGTIGIDSSGEPEVKEPVFISLSSFKNSKYLDIRKFYMKDDSWMPTKKGVTLQKDQITDLIKILQEKSAEIEDWFNE